MLADLTNRIAPVFFFLIVPFLLYPQDVPVRIGGNTQGTTYHITYYDKQNRNFQADIEKILVDFDKSVSTYLPASIISRVNSNEKNVMADNYFTVCFNKAKEVWENTNGAFDPTVYPLVNAWGFGPGQKLKLDKNIIDSILQFVGFGLIELKGGYVIKKDPRVSLDFNAFAQGYSVDVVSGFLGSKGIASYIVEIGGEVFAKGKKPDGENWKAGIEKPVDNPDSENPLKAIVKIEDMAVATSGNYRKFYFENGKRYAHHIDPETGYPAKNNLLSATVMAKDCISSDAYATGILVMGLENAIRYLELHKEIQAYLIYSDDDGNYRIFETPGMKAVISEAE